VKSPLPIIKKPETTTDPFTEADSTARGGKKDRSLDLEIKDAHLIFESVWSDLEQDYGRDQLRFPREIFWLNGAPGAGKGTQTRFIMRFRDLTAPPVVVSDLLDSPEAHRLKDAGMMVGDKEVTSLVFRRLLEPVLQSGAIVDGFPRTKVQVECLKLLYAKLMELRNAYRNTLHHEFFQKPIFHIIVLFVDEQESVRRQLLRGKQMLEHNEEVRQSGMGVAYEIRKTDLADDAARNRYRTFKEVTYESLKSLREVFHYHYINAHGTVDEVQERIIGELRYQSSLELDQATYDRMANIPLASQIITHARQELVRRLDDYQQYNDDLFRRVIALIERKFMPIVKCHAISGMAFINSEEEVFDSPMALAMLIDIFSERGFHAVVDLRKEEIADSVDPKTFRIKTRVKRVYRFRISFSGSDIRRGS